MSENHKSARLWKVKKGTFLLRNVSSDGNHIYFTILALDVDLWHDVKPVIS